MPPKRPATFEEMNFLVVDCGTSVCRASVISGNGDTLSLSRRQIRIDHPRPSFAEIDAGYLWNQVRKVIISEVEKHPDITFDAIGVSTMLGYVLLDKTPAPLMPAIIYMDNRAVAEIAEMKQLFSEARLFAITGRRSSPLLLAPKIKWLYKNRADVIKKLDHIIGLKDEIVRRLTGNIRTDFAHLDYSGCYNVHKGELESDIIDAVGIKKALFPSPTPATEIAGTVSADVAGQLGLTCGTPVITGSSDGTTAMYGAGVLEKGRAVLVSGSTDVLMMRCESAVQDPAHILSINTGMLPGTFLVGGALGLSGGALHYFEKMLQTSADKLADNIADLPPGSDGLLVFPGLTGERSPFWKEYLTGGIAGLSLHHKNEHILKALMEGCAFRILRLLKAMSASHLKPKGLNIVGGGANIDVWNHIRSDVTGMVIRKLFHTEATSLGTAMFCNAGIDSSRSLLEVTRDWIEVEKCYSPDPDATDRYKKIAAIFDRYMNDNENIYRRLNELSMHL